MSLLEFSLRIRQTYSLPIYTDYISQLPHRLQVSTQMSVERSDAPTIGAVIPRSTLTPTGADGAGALFYEIHLRVSPPSDAKASGVVPLEYVVYHRYSEFLALHQALVGDGAGVEAKVREAATSVRRARGDKR